MQLIQVLYGKDRRGLVDDITLDELIRSQKISHFYRPAEDKWVDIGVDPVRRSETRYKGPERRVSDKKEEKQEEKKPPGLFVRLLRRRKKLAPAKELTAGEWFQQGFLIMHNGGEYLGAMRAFAKAIQLDPNYQRAFVNRGMVYEWIGNGQQAVEDYSTAIQLAADDARVYYARGLVLRHLGREMEAIVDLKKAADLRYRPAIDALKSRGITS